MGERRLGPRLGLGPERVDPDWARFRSAADVLRYLADLNGWSHEQLAERCGTRREQISRWLTRRNEPSLARLTELLEPLGWTPLITLTRTEDVLIRLHTTPIPPAELLDHPVRAVLGVVARAAAEGLDVVVGGEVAAVLQGVLVPTRHLTVHLPPEQRERFAELARERWMSVEPAGRHGWRLRCWSVTAELRLSPVRPASRSVPDHDGHTVPVVDLAELFADPGAIGGSVRAAAGKLLDRAG